MTAGFLGLTGQPTKSMEGVLGQQETLSQKKVEASQETILEIVFWLSHTRAMCPSSLVYSYKDKEKENWLSSLMYRCWTEWGDGQ